MAKYTGVILTNKGKELLSRAILGEVIVFTKVEIGEGVLLPGTDKEALTSLVNSFKSLSITSTANLPNGGYRIRISFNNKGFIQDKYLREVGIYARGEDGVEILYSYCNTDTPNLIPNESSGIIESVEDIITYISNAATINAVIDQSNVYATIKDLVEGLATKENKFTKNDAFNRSFSHVISSTSKILVASAYAVKTAYDKGVTALSRANEAYTLASGKEPKITKKTGFNLDKSDLVTSTSSVLLATAKAVKIAYDKGLEALGLANTNKNAIQNNTEQIENLSLLGVGQNWVDLLSSRSKSVLYTNDTGKPIQVSISLLKNSISVTEFLIDGVTVAKPHGTATTNIVNIQCIVPHGSTYILSGYVLAIYAWAELR